MNRLIDAIIAIEKYDWKLIPMPSGESGQMLVPPDWDGNYEWHERIIPIHLSVPDDLLPRYSTDNEIVKIMKWLN